MSSLIVNIDEWLAANEKYFLPPVCNKLMHEKQLKIFYVGGPNQRKDFHIEEGEELFYMKKGSMDLVVLEHGRFRNLNIGEGEVFLLPGRVPHSPQRQRDTVGLVIERERSADEMDCLRYFVGETTEPLFERWFYCDDLGTQLPPVIREFFASEQCKTGLPIPGTIPEHPPYSPDSLRTLEEPFLLASWLQSNGEEIHSVGSKRLFDNSYQSDIIVYSDSSIGPIEAEIWLWQLEGESSLYFGGNNLSLKQGDTTLIPPGNLVELVQLDSGFTLSVMMNPGTKGRANAQWGRTASV